MMTASRAIAAGDPVEGVFDKRMRFIDYNPDDVTSLTVFAGFVTELAFSNAEQVIHAVAGTPTAYEVVNTGSSVIVRMKAVAPPSNLIVKTSKRSYWFDLIQAELKPAETSLDSHRDKRISYKVQFRFASDDFAASQTELSAAERVRIAQARSDEAAANASRTLVSFFSYQGNPALRPASAAIKGNFTQLTFARGQEIPSFYVTDADGSESPASRHMEDERTVVVHQIGRKIVMRRGTAVGCVFYDGAAGLNDHAIH